MTFFKAIGIRGGIAILLAGLLVWCWFGWERAADQRDQLDASLKLADAEIALLKVDADLKETAATERAADAAQVTLAEKELVDAIASIPDEKPDAVRVALGCERLRRRAGGVGADLPAVCRPGGRGQTPTD